MHGLAKTGGRSVAPVLLPCCSPPSFCTAGPALAEHAICTAQPAETPGDPMMSQTVTVKIQQELLGWVFFPSILEGVIS